MESIKAAKIQEHVIKDAGWIRGEVSYEISRLESLLRGSLTSEERAIAESQLSFHKGAQN